MMAYTEILSSRTVFNIDDNKKCLSLWLKLKLQPWENKEKLERWVSGKKQKKDETGKTTWLPAS